MYTCEFFYNTSYFDFFGFVFVQVKLLVCLCVKNTTLAFILRRFDFFVCKEDNGILLPFNFA